MTTHYELIANLSSDKSSCDLSACSLITVPVKELSKEPRIKKLDLSNNRIVSLPKNFISIANITWLDLSKNLLTTLPENFGSIVKLQHLDLYSNQLEILPLSFGNLKNLKWLDLKNNPLQEDFQKIAGDCLTSKQCEDCANRVTNFMRSMKKKVMGEKNKLKLKQEATEKQEQELEKQKVMKEGQQISNEKKKKKKVKEAVKQNGDKNKSKSFTNEADKKTGRGLLSWEIIYVTLFLTLIMHAAYTIYNGLKNEDTPKLIINARNFIQREIVQSIKYLYEFEFEKFYQDIKEFFTSLVS